jgi:hypothetical protein
VLPRIGAFELSKVRPRHLKNAFMDLRVEGKLAPHTIRNVYSVVRALFRDAMIDDLVDENSCILKEHELGRDQPKDPAAQASSRYDKDELERLISDARVPWASRMLWALGGLAGLRLGEIAALRWRDLDTRCRPLSKLTVARSHDKATTKTGRIREVPVHPVLAAMDAGFTLVSMRSWRTTRLINCCARHYTSPVEFPWHRALFAGVGVALMVACPTEQPPPQTTSGDPGATSDAEPPSPDGSICDQLSGGASSQDSSSSLGPCPDSTADAIDVEWLPEGRFDHAATSYVWFAVENLTREVLEVEYQAFAQQYGRDAVTLAVPSHTLDPGRKYVHAVDLQLGAFLNAFESGLVDVQVLARLVQPVETDWQQIGDLEVEIKVDPDSRTIYGAKLLRW